jgi:hypothetical protein
MDPIGEESSRGVPRVDRQPGTSLDDVESKRDEVLGLGKAKLDLNYSY